VGSNGFDDSRALHDVWKSVGLGRGTPHKSLSGALADLGVDLSAEDIDQARREAHASSGVAILNVASRLFLS